MDWLVHIWMGKGGEGKKSITMADLNQSGFAHCIWAWICIFVGIELVDLICFF